MTAASSRARDTLRALFVGSLVSLAGCVDAEPLVREGITLTPPASWESYEPPSPVWPARRLSSWKSDVASLAIYEDLPVPRGTAQNLALELTSRMENLPGIKILSTNPLKVGGLDATRVEISGTGDGVSFAPTGLGHPVLPEGTKPVPTRRVCIGIPRKGDTIWVIGHYPDRSETRAIVEPEIAAFLASMTLQNVAPLSSGY